MAAKLPTYDTKPWYRQFWPWFIMALPASVVIAGLSTLYIAIIHSDDLVAKDYYVDGLAINLLLEKNQLAAELGLQARFFIVNKPQASTVEVHISGPAPGNDLRLSMFHPLEADQDFVVLLPQRSPGVYGGQMPRRIVGPWHWVVEPTGPKPWRLDGTIAAGDLSDEPNK